MSQKAHPPGGQLVFLVTDGPKEPNVRMYGVRSQQNIALTVMPGVYYPATTVKPAHVMSLLDRPQRLEMGLNAVEILSETNERTHCRFAVTVLERGIDFGKLLPDNAPVAGRLAQFEYGAQLFVSYSYYKGTNTETSCANAGELATCLDRFWLPSPIVDLIRIYDWRGKGHYDLIAPASSQP